MFSNVLFPGCRGERGVWPSLGWCCRRAGTSCPGTPGHGSAPVCTGKGTSTTRYLLHIQEDINRTHLQENKADTVCNAASARGRYRHRYRHRFQHRQRRSAAQHHQTRSLAPCLQLSSKQACPFKLPLYSIFIASYQQCAVHTHFFSYVYIHIPPTTTCSNDYL